MPRNKDGAAPLGNPALPCGLIKQLIVEFARTHTHRRKKKTVGVSFLVTSELRDEAKALAR